MKNTKCFVIVLMLIVFCLSEGLAQPQVGKPMPDFTLTNVSGRGPNKISNKSLEGKWLFLDFWSLSCHYCVASFPKIDTLQDMFAEDVQFVLVGNSAGYHNVGIEKFYQKKQKELSLKVWAAFDSALFNRFEIWGVPTIFVVDPQGTVRFITSGIDLTAAKIRDMVAGKEVVMYDGEKIKLPFNYKSGILADLPEDKLLSYSILTKWNGEKMYSGYPFDRFVKLPKEFRDDGWHVSMLPLFGLYDLAFFGRWGWISSDTLFYGMKYRYPVLEVRDSSVFQYDYRFDVGKATYNYALKLPYAAITQERMMSELQTTLHHTFGFNASVERREVPVWKLIARPGAEQKLRTKGGVPFLTDDSTILGLKGTNQKLSVCLALITEYLPYEDHLDYVDETGITCKVDIEVEGMMTDLKVVRKELARYNLDLVRGQKMMDVIVIRDSDRAN